jgi:hypothetical protein
MHAVCQPAVDKNMLCDKPTDCASPLACASDYRCRNLCNKDLDCNAYGISGRVCAKDANGVDYCADPNEVMNGLLTVAPPSGAPDATVIEPSSSGVGSSGVGSSGVGSSGNGSSGNGSSGGTSSGASSGADSSGGASSGT